MRKCLVLLSFYFLLTQFSFGQCPPLSGVSPAFSFNVPAGVTITSVKVTITNYSHGGSHYRARIRSFEDLQTVSVFGDGEYQVLAAPIAGPSTQDLQVESGISLPCQLVGDFVKFNWLVEITATGTNGTLINYSGALTDNLAIPTYLGGVYNGTNRVSGSIDKTVTGGGITVYVDSDHDGYGDPSMPSVKACNASCNPGYVNNKLDCNDFDYLVNPGKTEIQYNGKDDDCNPATLDDDLDQDGYDGVIDCNDLNANINPGRAEIPYNGINDDCKAATRDDDVDGDGFLKANDCNDLDAGINSNQTEIPYNGKDDDCNAVTLDDDLDQDGFIKANDCDDADASINPNQTEITYNGKDDDCDPLTLDDDLDKDGFTKANECDDLNANINPDKPEIPYNGINDDCDPLTLDDDLDGDGFINSNDCDDLNENVNPDKTEITYNGIDDDCNPATLDDDLDEDGFIKAEDCDDFNENINPGKTETPYNGIDDDCDETTPDDDLDEDGFELTFDCDDSNSAINPDEEEIPNNGIDEDCSGSDLIITSIGNNVNEEVKIYPNPATNIIHVEFRNMNQLHVELFDLAGNKILAVDGQSEIDTRAVPQGIYFLKVKTGTTRTMIRKIIIARER